MVGGVLRHTVGVLRHQSPAEGDLSVWGLVGLWLFDFWIVDASIARTVCWCGCLFL